VDGARGRGWSEGTGLGAALGEIPAASAGMTELFRAGVTALCCAGVTREERGGWRHEERARAELLHQGGVAEEALNPLQRILDLLIRGRVARPHMPRPSCPERRARHHRNLLLQ